MIRIIVMDIYTRYDSDHDGVVCWLLKIVYFRYSSFTMPLTIGHMDLFIATHLLFEDAHVIQPKMMK